MSYYNCEKCGAAKGTLYHTPPGSTTQVIYQIRYCVAGCGSTPVSQASRPNCSSCERRFPIMEGPSIPWWFIASHEAQAKLNHDQTLERLAERGGLSPTEALAVLEDRRFSRGFNAETDRKRLTEIVTELDRPSQDQKTLANARAFLILVEAAKNPGNAQIPFPQALRDLGCSEPAGESVDIRQIPYWPAKEPK